MLPCERSSMAAAGGPLRGKIDNIKEPLAEGKPGERSPILKAKKERTQNKFAPVTFAHPSGAGLQARPGAKRLWPKPVAEDCPDGVSQPRVVAIRRAVCWGVAKW